MSIAKCTCMQLPPPILMLFPFPSVVFKNLTGENDNIEFHLLVLINSLRFTCNTSLSEQRELKALGCKLRSNPWLLLRCYMILYDDHSFCCFCSARFFNRKLLSETADVSPSALTVNAACGFQYWQHISTAPTCGRGYFACAVWLDLMTCRCALLLFFLFFSFLFFCGPKHVPAC